MATQVPCAMKGEEDDGKIKRGRYEQEVKGCEEAEKKKEVEDDKEQGRERQKRGRREEENKELDRGTVLTSPFQALHSELPEP